MSSEKQPKARTATVKGKTITIQVDAQTSVTRAVKPSDREEWPEAFRKKANVSDD